MGFLAALHRWWGVAFCLLFAMWFASGAVMHFVPYPERHERPATPEMTASRAGAELIDYDQWTVAGEFDYDRPLFRYDLNDSAGTEVYVSSRSGKVVLTTTRGVRVANYLGSIPHWIYLAPLRHHASVWRALLWWLSLLGTIGAGVGTIIGVVKLGGAIRDRAWPYHGLQAWHHALGLIFAPVHPDVDFLGLFVVGRCMAAEKPSHAEFCAARYASGVADDCHRGALRLRACVQPHRRGPGVAAGANQRMTGVERERRTNRAKMVESSLY